MKTYGEIYEHFLESFEPKITVEDYRPCIEMYDVPYISNAIVVWLSDGTKVIFIDTSV